METTFKFEGANEGNLKREMEQAIKDELRKKGISDLTPRVNVKDGSYDFPGASESDIERVKRAMSGHSIVESPLGILTSSGIGPDGRIVTGRRKKKSK